MARLTVGLRTAARRGNPGYVTDVGRATHVVHERVRNEVAHVTLSEPANHVDAVQKHARRAHHASRLVLDRFFKVSRQVQQLRICGQFF